MVENGFEVHALVRVTFTVSFAIDGDLLGKWIADGIRQYGNVAMSRPSDGVDVTTFVQLPITEAEVGS